MYIYIYRGTPENLAAFFSARMSSEERKTGRKGWMDGKVKGEEERVKERDAERDEGIEKG